VTVPDQPLDFRVDEDRKWRPPDSRLALVDAIRAYALIGLFLLHVEQQFELYWAAPKPSWSTTVVFGLFAGKTFSLLALSFGFSFFMMLEGAGRRMSSSRFAWRLTILVAIGSLHGAVYRGDIIVVLAICGFLLIPIHHVRSKAMLCAIAAFCFAQPYILALIVAGLAGAAWALKPAAYVSDPGSYLTGGLGEVLLGNLGSGQVGKWWFYYETGRIMQVMGLFIVGLLLGRFGFFHHPNKFRWQRMMALLGSVAAAVVLLAVHRTIARFGSGPSFWTDVLVSGWFNLACTAISLLVFVAFWQAGGEFVLRPLSPAGRMTLTLYVGQSLLFVPLFYPFGLGLYNRLSQEEALALGLVAVTLQVAFAGAWFLRFRYGPLEWLWRCATWLTWKVPILRHGEPREIDRLQTL
jgi:uncharacterized protein